MFSYSSTTSLSLPNSCSRSCSGSKASNGPIRRSGFAADMTQSWRDRFVVVGAGLGRRRLGLTRSGTASALVDTTAPRRSIHRRQRRDVTTFRPARRKLHLLRSVVDLLDDDKSYTTNGVQNLRHVWMLWICRTACCSMLYN